MILPEQAVTLSAEQIAELNQKLSTMRHDIANHLALVMATAELSRSRPETAERMIATLTEQPAKITASIQQFSAGFEEAFGIRR